MYSPSSYFTDITHSYCLSGFRSFVVLYKRSLIVMQFVVICGRDEEGDPALKTGNSYFEAL
jgi:hypothetical protein